MPTILLQFTLLSVHISQAAVVSKIISDSCASPVAALGINFSVVYG